MGMSGPSGSEFLAFFQSGGGGCRAFNIHIVQSIARGVHHAAHDVFVHLADHANSETVYHGEFAGIDNKAARFHGVVEALKREVRVGGAEEGDDDRAEPAVIQQGFEPQITHPGDHHIAVFGVARATGGHAAFGFMQVERVEEGCNCMSWGCVAPLAGFLHRGPLRMDVEREGVGIAFGTDAGVFKHGNNGKEFGFMVEAGMPAMKTIQSATITNATLLKMETELGQIQKGFFADIIAVDDDPTKNIATMENVVFVMKNGVVYKK